MTCKTCGAIGADSVYDFTRAAYVCPGCGTVVSEATTRDRLNICLACGGAILEAPHRGDELPKGGWWCRCRIGPPPRDLSNRINLDEYFDGMLKDVRIAADAGRRYQAYLEARAEYLKQPDRNRVNLPARLMWYPPLPGNTGQPLETHGWSASVRPDLPAEPCCGDPGDCSRPCFRNPTVAWELNHNDRRFLRACRIGADE